MALPGFLTVDGFCACAKAIDRSPVIVCRSVSSSIPVWAPVDASRAGLGITKQIVIPVVKTISRRPLVVNRGKEYVKNGRGTVLPTTPEVTTNKLVKKGSHRQ
jgi:hypothetical protein